MKKQLKFRIWNKQAKQFVTDPSGGISHFTPFGLARYFIQCGYTSEPEELIIQQFTGLKDQDGEEIYEGDLLRHTYTDQKGRRAHVFQEMKFEELQAGDDMDMDSYGYHINPNWNNCFSICGNVFEPPKKGAKILK